MYATLEGLRRFKIPHKFQVVSVISLYAQWIREGRLKVDPSWNKDGLRFTVQDPCKLVRQTLGDGVAEDLRFVIKKVVGEENFVDVWPRLSNNYCCGGGGGALQAGFVQNRREYGRLKFEQLAAADPDVVITPCHNCHTQIKDITEFYGGKWQTTHLWNWITRAMVR